MKRISQALVAALLAFSFAGCAQAGGTENDFPSGPVSVFEVDTPNGTYQCIAWDSRRAGGMQCDPMNNNP